MRGLRSRRGGDDEVPDLILELEADVARLTRQRDEARGELEASERDLEVAEQLAADRAEDAAQARVTAALLRALRAVPRVPVVPGAVDGVVADDVERGGRAL
jgi:septal ring factor EnvC (AmiA/AmiB activator)